MTNSGRIGSYEPLLLLASGGMGTVHAARRVGAAGFARLVAIKRIHRHLAGDPEFRAMLVDEARLTASIRHPNVVQALDVVEGDGELAIVLDYVEAVSLAELAHAAVQKGQRLGPATLARILADALAGLHAAHEAKDLSGRSLAIVHRDVSPQNVLVGTDGMARLIDFGIAKAAERISMTNTGVLKGKLRYMSPEQARRKPIDRRSDLFAVGAVMYECFCGRPVFPGTTEASILVGLLSGEKAPPTSPEGRVLSPAIEAVLDRALAPNLDDRYATAADLQHALVEAIPPASHEEVAEAVRLHAGAKIERLREELTRAIVERASAIPALEAQVATPEPRPAARASRRRWIGVTVVGFAAASGVVAIVARSRATAPPPVTESTESAGSPSTSASSDPSASTDVPLTAPTPTARPPAAPRRTPTSPHKTLLHGNPYR